jgi:mRNA-degrading endonuclease YafQ of YafQ-DinJ toxin-antitoxin module
VTGSNRFSIEETENFKRSFKKLGKVHKSGLINEFARILEGLLDHPYPSNAREEPLPSNVRLPEGWTFHKIAFKVARGASGQIRLMYLVNEEFRRIRLLWLYSHEQFVGRPSDKSLKSVIQDALDSQE